jgi:hypothetical protein
MTNAEKAQYYDSQYQIAKDGESAGPLQLKQLKSKADHFRALARVEISKSTTSNRIAQAQAEYTHAKETVQTKQAEAQSAAKHMVANNTTVVNKNTSTTEVSAFTSRYNNDPTVMGTNFHALPGVV